MSQITTADLKTVYKVTYEARNKWRNILLELGVSSAAINSIGMRWHENPEDCYREGLSEWLKGGERSWGDLVEALSSHTVDHCDITMVIKRDYIKSVGTTTKVTSGRHACSCLVPCTVGHSDIAQKNKNTKKITQLQSNVMESTFKTNRPAGTLV